MGREAALSLALLVSLALDSGAQTTVTGSFTPTGSLTITKSTPVVSSAACTPGTNCWCDTRPADPARVFCEDYESESYYGNTGNSFVAGLTGDGGGWDRGGLSRWVLNYGSAAFNDFFVFPNPASPYIGQPCGYGPGSAPPRNSYQGCQGVKEFCSLAQGIYAGVGVEDCWGPGTNATASLDIQRSGDFSAENPSLTLTGGLGTTPDVGFNRTHMAYRIFGPSETGPGVRQLGRTLTEVGVTFLNAYASNVATSGVQSQPWKHEEWFGSGPGEHWFQGYTGALNNPTFRPYMPALWVTGLANCNAAFTNVQMFVGGAHCNVGGNLGLSANGSHYPNDNTGGAWRNSNVTAYNQATDWPHGTWRCTRAHIKGMGTTNLELKVWHENNLIIHLVGFDATKLQNQGYSRLWMNAYSNAANLGFLTEKTWRYRDNWYVREGPPISCDEARS